MEIMETISAKAFDGGLVTVNWGPETTHHGLSTKVVGFGAADLWPRSTTWLLLLERIGHHTYGPT